MGINSTYGEKKRIISFNLDKEMELYELSKEINLAAFVKKHLRSELSRRKSQRSTSAELTVKLKGDE